MDPYLDQTPEQAAALVARLEEEIGGIATWIVRLQYGFGSNHPKFSPRHQLISELCEMAAWSLGRIKPAHILAAHLMHPEIGDEVPDGTFSLELGHGKIVGSVDDLIARLTNLRSRYSNRSSYDANRIERLVKVSLGCMIEVRVMIATLVDEGRVHPPASRSEM